jgi:hypothetical protein
VAASFQLAVCGPGPDRRRSSCDSLETLGSDGPFWDATLRDDPAAQAWLDGDGPQSVLGQDDQWQKK